MNETFAERIMEMDILKTQAKTKLPYKIGFNFHLYYFPIVALIGLVGNALSLCILLKPRNRKFPCYRTLTALSISDSIILLGGYYNWIILLMDGMTETHCKIWTYIFQTAALSSAVMASFVTVHKYMAFLSPFKSHKWRSPQRTLKIVFVICASSMAYNVVHIYATNTIDGKICIGITNKTSYSRALSSVALVFNTILPVIAVTIMNTLIVKALNKSKKFHQSSVMSSSKTSVSQTKESQNQPTEDQPKNGKLSTKSPKDPLRHYDKPTQNYHKNSAVLLIAVTIAFAFLTPPLFAYYVVYNFVDYEVNADAYSIYVMLYYIFM